MGETTLRPIGGFYVRRRSPEPGKERFWREPLAHATLAIAFDEAERLARKTGSSFGIYQEVGAADPVLKEIEPEEAARAEKIAALAAQAADLQAQIEALSQEGR